MTVRQRLQGPFRYVWATALATLSGAVVGSLPSLPSIGSPSEPPGAWVGQVLSYAILALPGVVVAVLPLSLVVHWIMRRRRLRGPIAAAIAGCGVAVATVVGYGWLPLLASNHEAPSYWFAFLPPVLCLAGFAISWPMFLQWLDPSEPRPSPEAGALHVRTRVDRALQTTIETLSVVAALAPLVVVGLFMAFVVGLGAGENWHPGRIFPSRSNSHRAYVVDRYWGGAVGGIDTQVYVLPSTRHWTEGDRGLLVWSGRHVDSLRVVWDSEDALRVQPHMSKTAPLNVHAHAWSRSGFSVRTEPLP